MQQINKPKKIEQNSSLRKIFTTILFLVMPISFGFMSPLGAILALLIPIPFIDSYLDTDCVGEMCNFTLYLGKTILISMVLAWLMAIIIYLRMSQKKPFIERFLLIILISVYNFIFQAILLNLEKIKDIF